jgi:hypothetical protein
MHAAVLNRHKGILVQEISYQAGVESASRHADQEGSGAFLRGWQHFSVGSSQASAEDQQVAKCIAIIPGWALPLISCVSLQNMRSPCQQCVPSESEASGSPRFHVRLLLCFICTPWPRTTVSHSVTRSVN